MCIVIAYADPAPDPRRYKLILTMNRDELFHRPTSPAEWKDGILCGRDKLTPIPGGTWCGMNKEGRIGVLTNLLVGSSNNLVSRGPLISNYLRGQESPSEYLRNLARSKVVYKPYNLVLMEQNKTTGAYELFYLAQNLNDKTQKRNCGPYKINNPILALSNHPLLKPFIKTTMTSLAAEEVFLHENSLENKEKVVDSLFDILSSETKYYPDPQIDDQKLYDDFLNQNYYHFASTYITGSKDYAKGFGTRTQTVILVDYDNNVEFIEKTRHVENGDGGLEEYWTEIVKTFQIS